MAPGTWQYVHQRTIADHYDAFVEDTPLCRVDAQVLAEVLPGIDSPGNEIVLDLGCGTGRAALPLAQRGYDVVGIDLSHSMLEVLVQKSASQPTLGSIFPLHANLVQLDSLADNTADHAVCLFATMGMIQGRPNRQQVLRHVARIVRPGGSLTIHVHNRWAALQEASGYRSLISSWWKSVTPHRWQRSRNGTAGYEFGDATYGYRGLKDMFMHRFSRRELTHDLAATGWDIDRCMRLSIDGTTVLSDRSVAGGFIFVARAK
ncbi:class I SAM-dependent methyltransferase [Rubripirellula lacrimiformis]|uniref:class I SAM-dependent methyltransferase n=1 Tax=Rubripirellula lacrimiformis TaxID=1930273 RepID=UPI001FE77F54|nr:class I SAM-dependent methyltransferase [Rubripirellula lacrimiformis]